MRISLYFILLFSTMSIFAQSKESLSDQKYVLTKNEYQYLQDNFRNQLNSDLDSAFYFANKIEKSTDLIQKAFGTGAKSYLFQLKGDSTKSKEFYKKSFQYLEKASFSEEKVKTNAYLLNYGGLSDWKRGNLKNAIIEYQKGQLLSEKANDIIQIIKFKYNIGLIYNEINNCKEAIKIYRQSDKLIDNYQNKYSPDQFIYNKNNINLNLGLCYEKLFTESSEKLFLLDSSIYFFKKSTIFSTSRLSTVKAKIELANIYRLKNETQNAEKTFLELLTITKENQFEEQFFKINLHLGILYFETNKFEKSLICLKKVDSIHKLTKLFVSDYAYSNYFQAKIYDSFHDSEKSSNCSKIYLSNFENSEFKLDNEKELVNSTLETTKLKKEMLEIQEKTKMEFLYKKIAMAFIFILIVFLAFIFYNKHLENKNFKRIIEEFSQKPSKIDIYNKPTLVSVDVEIKPKPTKSISIDEEKENEIVEKLKNLELKNEFLKMDFTQTFVSKKIKTNTTYLSYVVNNRFEKSFSEYANDLKINYAIEKLISDSTYRKYSTQAIAESVGFKNAISFTKSFSKKTGMSPAQFAKKFL